MKNNPKTRFSDRVENYIKYRPGYPNDILEFLSEKKYINKQTIVADIGSGTGISTEMFLKNGNKVFAVEPNSEMRAAAEKLLNVHEKFHSINASAEDTSLEANSIDLIVCAQAFHWFEPIAAKAEFRRILKPGGKIVLMWNERKLNATPFLEAYEALLLKYGTDYTSVRHENVDENALQSFFENGYEVKEFENSQQFDLEGVKGRLMSSSYAPSAADPGYDEMMSEIETIFRKYNSNGYIDFQYLTGVYLSLP